MPQTNLLDLSADHDEPWADLSRWARGRTQHQRAARGHLAVAEQGTDSCRWFVTDLTTGRRAATGIAADLPAARRAADRALDAAAGTLPLF